jgi:squalene-hopene/tetraprenyl-beta-curcumene cyclase
LASPVRRAIVRTRQWLLEQQQADGSWCAELEGDTILESETILLLAFLGREDSPQARRLAQYLIDMQLPDGGWAKHPDGDVDVSASVKAYFALKLTGHSPSEEYVERARQAILAHGGADAVNSYTRYFLALLGQISYDQCPAVPPEALLMPKWFPVNLYNISAWSRTMVVPLSIVSALRPVREIEPQRGIRELFLRGPKDWPSLRCPGLPGGTGLLSWDRFFRTVDRLLQWAQRHRLLPLRHRAIRAAEAWILKRFEHSDGLGAIYPPIIFSLVALKCLGYADDSPPVQSCLKELEALAIDDEAAGSTRIQPCKSPIWDTAITLRALHASGVGTHRPEMRRGVEWLLERQTTRRGDWAETVQAAPGGWYFQYANEFYPDVDDTAMALMALYTQFTPPSPGAQALPPDLHLFGADIWRDGASDARHDRDDRRGSPDPATDNEPESRDLAVVVDAAAEEIAVINRTLPAIDRGLKWILAMQNNDGGWGAFDRNNDHEFLCHVPFADHNAMIDPSTPDLAGRVLEALGKLGRRVGDPTVDRAVRYIRTSQEADGSWFGRWGVNYIYGTWQALTGLLAVGVGPKDPAVVAGVNWLLAHQQPSGGWGESAESYENPRLRGQGTTTASQTAWAIMALVAAGLADHPAVTRGIRYLVIAQQEDGTWDEPEFTGTGFPCVFYLRYHYYPIYFPLLALAQWAVEAACDFPSPSPAR